jgi:iron complex outermembrane recepter protein
VVPVGRVQCVRSCRPLALIGSLLSATNALALEPASADLTDLSLEDLAEVKVTGVSKTSDDRALAAAVYVLTQEDIRRSGATSLPAVLRSVRGVEVARKPEHAELEHDHDPRLVVQIRRSAYVQLTFRG